MHGGFLLLDRLARRTLTLLPLQAYEAAAAALVERRAMSSLAQTSYAAEHRHSQGMCLHSPAPGLLQQTGQRRGLFIQTQSTPNPASLMFQPGSTVMEVCTDKLHWIFDTEVALPGRSECWTCSGYDQGSQSGLLCAVWQPEL